MNNFRSELNTPIGKLLAEPVTAESELLVREHRSYNMYLLRDALSRDTPPRLYFNSLELDVNSFGPGWTVYIERDIFFSDMIELMDGVDDFSRQVRRTVIVWN